MRGYGEMMAEVARQEIARWPVGEPFALWPRMQADQQRGGHALRLRRHRHASSLRELRTLLKRLTDWLNDPARLSLLSAARLALADATTRLPRGDRAGGGGGARGGRRRRAAAQGRRATRASSRCSSGLRRERRRRWTQQELRDELITLLSDGPTATSLAWAFERLLRHPEKLARLRAEVLAGEQRHLRRRGRQGDAAPVPGGAARDAKAGRADGARRPSRSPPARSSPRAST
jgi:hypothetical protein